MKHNDSNHVYSIPSSRTLHFLLAFLIISILAHAAILYSTTATSALTNRHITSIPQNDSISCPRPILYNKPHKTGSTSIKADLLAWAASQHRPAYVCSPHINVSQIRIRECVPPEVHRSRCRGPVIAAHIRLDDSLLNILTSYIADKPLLVTSTRSPETRITSQFLQYQHTKLQLGKPLPPKLEAALQSFLRNWNPWQLYNYHTGSSILSPCPLSYGDRRRLEIFVNRYDVVIDVDRKNVSNVVLKSFDLFQLSGRVENVRGTGSAIFTSLTDQLLANVSCVETEMHRLFSLRLASLYQRASGERCLEFDKVHRIPVVTCF